MSVLMTQYIKYLFRNYIYLKIRVCTKGDFKLRIMYLMFSFTTGGMERLVADICNKMSARNHKVYLCVINDYLSEQVLDTVNSNVNVILIKRNPSEKSKIKFLFNIARIVKEEKIEIIHCNGIRTIEAAVVAKVYSPKVKLFYTIHDVGQYKTFKPLDVLFRNLICTKIIAISECVKNEMIEFGAWDKKVIVIHNAIDLERFSNSAIKKFDRNSIKIGNVARLIPEKKGQDLLIEAVALLKKKYPSVTCYFAGEVALNNNHSLDILNNLANELKVKDNVIFLGNVENVKDFLKTIDIFVLPSRYEGFGISLIEALAMGVPSVASQVDGPLEILKDEEYGLLFETGNAKMLAQKLDWMITNMDKFINTREKCIGYIHDNYSIIGMCNKLEDIYKLHSRNT